MDFPTDLNGWTIYAHPCFKQQYDELLQKVEALKKKYPEDYQKKADTKIFAHVLKSIVNITNDPRAPEFRLGNTLGEENKNWSRIKLVNGRYRLFFRFSFKEKIIILAWINDNDTLRTYGNKTNAYRVFEKKLKKGHPPKNWNDLFSDCINEADCQDP